MLRRAQGRPPPAAAHVAVPIPAVPAPALDAPIWIEGHPGQEYNGLYLKCVEGVRDVHGGWPVYKRDVDKQKDVRYCYRHGTKSPKWMLHEKYTPNEAVCNAQIDGSAGPVPAGEHSWSVYRSVKHRRAARTLFHRPYLAHFCSFFRRFFAVLSVLAPGFQKVGPEDRGPVA